jgi:hypothetical protein
MRLFNRRNLGQNQASLNKIQNIPDIVQWSHLQSIRHMYYSRHEGGVVDATYDFAASKLWFVRSD